MFHNQKILEQCLSIKGQFDGCIILGDFIDEFWISFFRKELASSHRSEVDAGTFIIDLLAKRFGRVLYIQGNHEDRRWKQLLEVCKPMADLAEGKAKEVYDLAERLRSWYFNERPNVTVVNHWFTTIAKGRIVVSHPDRFLKVPGQAPAAVLEHFYGHRRDYKMDDIDGLFMGHTHRMSGPTHRLGVWTMECACMCGILPYQAGSAASNAGTVDTGYFVLTTKPDGSVWFNESRSYLLEE
jgi:predicted phosphodiesterase